VVEEPGEVTYRVPVERLAVGQALEAQTTLQVGARAVTIRRVVREEPGHFRMEMDLHQPGDGNVFRSVRTYLVSSSTVRRVRSDTNRQPGRQLVEVWVDPEAEEPTLRFAEPWVWIAGHWKVEIPLVE
jgi:hypothetical protein